MESQQYFDFNRNSIEYKWYFAIKEITKTSFIAEHLTQIILCQQTCQNSPLNIVYDSIQVTINSILTCVIRSIISGHDGRYRSITAAEGIIGWLRETVTFTILQIVPFPMDSQWPPCLGPSESQSVFHSVSIVISNQSHTYPIS